jgi:hypothetical protein
MATREIITLICDRCGTHEDVETKKLTIGTRSRWMETCPPCWAPVQELMQSGRAARDQLRRVS